MSEPLDPARGTGADPTEDPTYEQARDELVAIVARLEGGDADLEESLRLWERGEHLAAVCQRWLDQAQARVDASVPGRQPAGADPDDDEADDSVG